MPFVVLTNISLWVSSSSLRIQKPRAVIGAPPVLVIVPVSWTVVLVVTPLSIVSVGKFDAIGDAVILAGVPAPAELTALTLKLCCPGARLVKVWLVVVCAVTHGPLFKATSYLIIGAPPLFAGASQVNVT